MLMININNVEMVSAENREEAVEIIKEKMMMWMQSGDRLVWTLRGSDAENEPGLVHVYNEVGDATDSIAVIMNHITQDEAFAVSNKFMSGHLLSFEEYKIAIAKHFILNHGEHLQPEYEYVKNVWHYEDDKIRGYLNFEKPKPEDKFGFRPVGFGVYMSQVKREFLNERQIEEFKRHGWKDEEIGR